VLPADSPFLPGTALRDDLGSRPIIDGGDCLGSPAWSVANARQRDLVGGDECAGELAAAHSAGDASTHEEPIEGSPNGESDECKGIGHR
jgi:hypothetical protein